MSEPYLPGHYDAMLERPYTQAAEEPPRQLPPRPRAAPTQSERTCEALIAVASYAILRLRRAGDDSGAEAVKRALGEAVPF